MPRVNASSEGLRVNGLNELNRALKAIGGRELQGELKKAGLTVANVVADDAVSNAYSLGGVAAHVAPSIKAAARFTGAGVSLGGSSHPAAAGAEFGGQGRPTTQQFAPWRGSGSSAGYFVYPAIRSNSDRIADEYLEAVVDLARKYDLI